jgi:hypothetical protein
MNPLLNGLPYRFAAALNIFDPFLESLLSNMAGLYPFPFKFSLGRLKLKDWSTVPKSKPC